MEDKAVVDGTRFTGAQSSELVFNQFGPLDVGRYRLRVWNDCGEVWSDWVTAAVEIGLRIESVFGGGYAVTWEGDGAVLEESAAVTGPWVSIPGAVSPHRVHPDAQARFYRLRLR